LRSSSTVSFDTIAMPSPAVTARFTAPGPSNVDFVRRVPDLCLWHHLRHSHDRAADESRALIVEG
jgi:hypothetical protein